MTRVVSIRLPTALERTIRLHASRAQAQPSHLAAWVLSHALRGQYSFAALRDCPESLDAKLDIRIAEELISTVRSESARTGVLVSVYIRTILHAYYKRRLIFIKTGKRYTLVANDDQTKSS
jgi:hypothetical protein